MKIAEWIKNLSTCAADAINSFSFVAPNCSFNNKETNCLDPAKPGAIAHIKCRDHYKRQEGEQITFCGEDGIWSPLPEAWSQICGEKALEVVPNSVGGFYKDITKSPWHVGIYIVEGTSCAFLCDGTILNALIIISGMHCFWNRSEEKPCDSLKLCCS